MRCQRCKKQEGLWKVLNKKTNQEQMICVWCEEPTDTVIEAPVADTSENNPVISPENNTNLEEYGRLHPVMKTKKPAICRICNKTIPVGSKCYNQSFKPANAFFPTQTKICFEPCGKILIAEGVEVCLK